jgi:ECF sigma factor
MSDVTRILSQIESGDPSAAEQLLPLVYEELRRLATARLAQEKPDQTPQPTALIHEAYVRLVDGEQARHWDSRGHFFCGGGGGHTPHQLTAQHRPGARSVRRDDDVLNIPRTGFTQGRKAMSHSAIGNAALLAGRRADFPVLCSDARVCRASAPQLGMAVSPPAESFFWPEICIFRLLELADHTLSVP